MKDENLRPEHQEADRAGGASKKRRFARRDRGPSPLLPHPSSLVSPPSPRGTRGPLRRIRFEQLVRRAIQRLPVGFSCYLDNVAILLVDEPSPEQRLASRLDPNDRLFGLYEGIPATQRTSDYGFALPDRITLFRRAFEEGCETEAAMIEEIRRTIIHEVGHHRGFDEDALRNV